MSIAPDDHVIVNSSGYVSNGITPGMHGRVIINAGTYSLVDFGGVQISIWNKDLAPAQPAVAATTIVVNVATTDAKPKDKFVDKEEMWRAIQDVSGGRK